MDNNKNTVYGEYNALSYTIFHNGEEVYQAGNSALDSQGYVSAKKGVGLTKMREYCATSAQEHADELNATNAGIFFESEE